MFFLASELKKLAIGQLGIFYVTSNNCWETAQLGAMFVKHIQHNFLHNLITTTRRRVTVTMYAIKCVLLKTLITLANSIMITKMLW